MAVVTLWLDATPSVALGADTGAHVVRETWLDQRTLDIAIQSPALDAPPLWVRLLLPPGWSRTTTRTWPTLYLLHGGSDDHACWTERTAIEQLSADRQAIVAMPGTSWSSADSDWWDVRQILERGYRASRVRAIAGVSRGGAGAMTFAARHPGMFAAAASFDGNVDPLDDLAAKLSGTQLYVACGDGAHSQSRAFVDRLQSLEIPVTSRFYNGTHGWDDWRGELRRALPLLLSSIGA